MNPAIKSLGDFLSRADSLAVLSGAGVSTASGIPDYRDREGGWKHAQPMQYGDFVRSDDARKRYWSRSYVGWQRFSAARPNAAHHALARLESTGKVDTLITQNVDGLHSKAGSRRVIDLHGRLSKVICLNCSRSSPRSEYQQELKDANSEWHAEVFRYKPDGDAELAANSHEHFNVTGCAGCGGIVKPDVVMFGEAVPKDRVRDASTAIERTNALLVIGSSLMVFSGFRFARQAREQRKPIAIVNQGRTRADEMATLKVDVDCTTALSAALDLLGN